MSAGLSHFSRRSGGALLLVGLLVLSVRGAEAARRNAIRKVNSQHENGLGMKFVPVPNTSVLFSVWETRVQDFEAFVRTTGHKPEEGMFSQSVGEWRAGRTWKNPGFAQTKRHPVCGVSWEDAMAFCSWLTKRERAAGRIDPKQIYRLPNDEEWSAAVGLKGERGETPESKQMKVRGAYPWGRKFPPPPGAGNYAGREAPPPTGWPAFWTIIDGHRDQFPRTAPVSQLEGQSLLSTLARRFEHN